MEIIVFIRIFMRLLCLYLQAPFGLMAMALGLLPFIEGINACFHGAPITPEQGIIFCIAGLAACHAGFYLFADALAVPGRERT
jgi:hypothetical protein